MEIVISIICNIEMPIHLKIVLEIVMIQFYFFYIRFELNSVVS